MGDFHRHSVKFFCQFPCALEKLSSSYSNSLMLYTLVVLIYLVMYWSCPLVVTESVIPKDISIISLR